jgi:tetratricopeptide (TPR) repeat protein
MLLFSRATNYGFTNYDDPFYVLNNPGVNGGLTWDGVAWAFTGKADYWHPLTWLSHMLDWQLYGDQAGGHHLTSVLWHAANAVLAFLVLRRLTGAFWMSASYAALFAWHPLRVESVAWITERKDVMSGCFFLLTLWSYAAYTERAKGKPRFALGTYWLTLALFALGLMCKPMLVTVPLVLLILDFWPLRRAGIEPADWPCWRELLIEKMPFFTLSVAAAAATVFMQRAEGAFVLQLPFTARLGNAVVSVARYLGKFFWPFDLAVCYPHPGYWPAVTVVTAIALVAGLTTIAWRQHRRRPWLLAGWLWFLVMLLPVIGLVQVGFQAMADRYTYLPMLGWQLALLWTLSQRPLRAIARRAATALGIAVLLGCAARTWDQQATWRDTLTLFSHATAAVARNDVAEEFLAYELVSLGRVEEADRHCRRALEINPQNANAYYTLARIQEAQGRLDAAIASLRTARHMRPNDPQREYMLGVLLLHAGQHAEGKAHLTAVLRRRPDFVPATLKSAALLLQRGQPALALSHYEAVLAAIPGEADANFGCGLALAALGRTEEALQHYDKAATQRPDFVAAHMQAGFLLARLNHPAEAADHFRTALALTPKLRLAHVSLGQAEEKLGRAAEATAIFARALVLAPRDPVVLRAWAAILARRGQFIEAVPYYESALREAPDDAGLHAELGYALYLCNRRSEAAAQWQEALRLDPNFPGLRDRLQRLHP